MRSRPRLSFRAQPRNPGRSHTNDPRTWEIRVAPRGRRVLDGARSWILRLRCAPLRMTVVVGLPCTRALANVEPPPIVIPSAAEESRTIAHQRPKDLGDTRGASGAEGTRWRKVLDSSTPLRSAQNDSGGWPSVHSRTCECGAASVCHSERSRGIQDDRTPTTQGLGRHAWRLGGGGYSMAQGPGFFDSAALRSE